MAVSFVGAGAAASGFSGALAPTIHASTAVGDVMFLAMHVNDDELAPTITGWTEFLWDVSTAGADLSIGLFYRVYTGSGDAPSVPQQTNGAICQIATFRGVRTDGNPFFENDVGFNTSAQNIGPTSALGAVTPSNGAILVIGSKRNISWTSVATLSGDGLTWNEIGEPDDTGAAPCGLVWDYALYSSPPTVTAKTFTVTGGSATEGGWIAVAIRPSTGTTHTAAASLAGAGSLAAPGAVTLAGSVALAGLGSVTATPQATRLAAVGIAGSSSLSAPAQVGHTHEGAAQLAGQGALTATGVAELPASAVIAGLGLVVAEPTVLKDWGEAVVAGLATVDATASLEYAGAAALPGAGLVAATGQVSRTAAAGLAGASGVAAGGQLTRAAAARITGQGAVSGTGGGVVTGPITIAGIGRVVAIGRVVLQHQPIGRGPRAGSASYGRPRAGAAGFQNRP